MMQNVYYEKIKLYFKDTSKLIARAPKSSEFLFADSQGTFEVNETVLTTQAND